MLMERYGETTLARLREAGAGSSNLLTPTSYKKKGRFRKKQAAFFRWLVSCDGTDH